MKVMCTGLSSIVVYKYLGRVQRKRLCRIPCGKAVPYRHLFIQENAPRLSLGVAPSNCSRKGKPFRTGCGKAANVAYWTAVTLADDYLVPLLLRRSVLELLTGKDDE